MLWGVKDCDVKGPGAQKQDINNKMKNQRFKLPKYKFRQSQRNFRILDLLDHGALACSFSVAHGRRFVSVSPVRAMFDHGALAFSFWLSVANGAIACSFWSNSSPFGVASVRLVVGITVRVLIRL